MNARVSVDDEGLKSENRELSGRRGESVSLSKEGWVRRGSRMGIEAKG